MLTNDLNPNFRELPQRDRVIVALDCNAAWEAIVMADALVGKASWVKVGMTLYYAEGPAIIQMFKRRGFKVFLDLKFHDIPHQIEGAARSAAASGADMITMHTVGGLAMMQAAQRGAVAGAAEIGASVPATLGITVLTSMDDEALASTGVTRPLRDQVLALADLARNAGISGVVASPQEAAALRELLGPDAFIVTPGVRPAGAALGDQSRVATPAEAFAAGASHIVVGRPITQAPDPAAAFDAIAAELEG
ncbi:MULTISPECIES: orotidine-5'-phosphate decarboxylase [unclassified Adlercreutzia]|uniref:orotidine-5'-phosphate decarboxylase n=1 Tax=unclassified Adlercreutzia TaxID=2636013 RepID=UPI0013EDE48B|nr:MULTISPECIES: orotidine-5'-phosphate decarboxylase [unclassified Adlercreutzia]